MPRQAGEKPLHFLPQLLRRGCVGGPARVDDDAPPRTQHGPMQADLFPDPAAETIAEDSFAESARRREADLRTGRFPRQAKRGKVRRLMTKAFVVDLFELSRPQ